LYYVDSHIHLASREFRVYHEQIFGLMFNTQIQCFCMSENLDSSYETVHLQRNHLKGSNLLKAFVGIHPQFATALTDIDPFEHFFNSSLAHIHGIGEIGLDPTYVNLELQNSMESQKFIFHHMLQLAEQNQKPISIHSRKSVGDILEILPSYRIKNAVFHWYEGSKKNLNKINELNFFVSFGPYILYNKEKQKMLQEADINLVLLETDGPVAYKKCLNNVLTSPSLIISTQYLLGNIIKKSFREITDLLYLNASRFLNGQ
jgi:TatD DNase family protein